MFTLIENRSNKWPCFIKCVFRASCYQGSKERAWSPTSKWAELVNPYVY